MILLKFFREIKNKLENSKGDLYISLKDGEKIKIENVEIYVGGTKSHFF